MCGIAGIVALAPPSPRASREAIERMTRALGHRGPDQSGVFVDRAVALGHTRLSIIDLAGGRQPMSDGRHVVVYNGEIFNYVELREELRARGHTFSTESDTEVLLRAWVEWGEGALRRFDGQFALAIWDKLERTLVLARDPLGVRPIHTTVHDGALYFASEVKAIYAADDGIARALDPRGIDETFTFWSCVAPRTPFAGVDEVPAGHVRTYDVERGRVTERCWFEAPFPPRAGRGGGRHASEAFEQELVDAVRCALERAVRLRMRRADVPVGAYLSGGLDSSLVAALARRSTARFSTFSVRFEDAEYDETTFQREVARALGTDHHELLVSREDIARALPSVVAHAERPILRTAPAPLFLLSGLVREAGIKVVLTGEGADEIFAGYDLFREGKVRRFWAKDPSSTLRPLLLTKLYPYLARSPVARQAMAERFFGRDLARASEPGFAHGIRWQTTRALKHLFSAQLRAELASFDAEADFREMLPLHLPEWTPLAQDQWIEMRTLLAGYLLSSQGDRMLMAHSIEGRFPFLDSEVVDLAARLPDGMKLRGLDEKHVLKRVAEGLLPASVARRTKQPYRAPDALALTSKAARDYASEALGRRAVERAGVFDPDAVERLWKKCRARAEVGQLSNTDTMALTGVLSTQLLYEIFVRRAVTPPSPTVDEPLPHDSPGPAEVSP